MLHWILNNPSESNFAVAFALSILRASSHWSKAKIFFDVWIFPDLFSWFSPSANEVYEGYVFTPACHSVHRDGVSRPRLRGEVAGSARGLSRPRPMGGPGPRPRGRGCSGPGSEEKSGVCPGGVQAQAHGGVSRPRPRGRGCSGQGCVCIPACTEADTPFPPPADSYCCGWYASYWNAFLFLIIFVFAPKAHSHRLPTKNVSGSEKDQRRIDIQQRLFSLSLGVNGP